MKKYVKIYLRTTTDELELPVEVAGSAEELARMLGKTKDVVQSSIAHHYAGWHRIIIEENGDEK